MTLLQKFGCSVNHRMTKEMLVKELLSLLREYKVGEKHEDDPEMQGGNPELMTAYGGSFKTFLNKVLKQGRKGVKKSLQGVKSLIKMLKNPDERDELKEKFMILSNTYRHIFCPQVRDLEKGELHIPCHNFSGPGTVMSEKNIKEKPFNNIDACSKTHDIAYDRIRRGNYPSDTKAQMIQEADREALDCYDNFPKEWGYKLAKAGIGSKVKIEELLSAMAKKPTVIYGGCQDNERFSFCPYCSHKL